MDKFFRVLASLCAADQAIRWSIEDIHKYGYMIAFAEFLAMLLFWYRVIWRKAYEAKS